MVVYGSVYYGRAYMVGHMVGHIMVGHMVGHMVVYGRAHGRVYGRAYRVYGRVHELQACSSCTRFYREWQRFFRSRPSSFENLEDATQWGQQGLGLGLGL